MPKIKLTKSELKTQRDSLRQFTRFLPTLQLKKQQLQIEMRKCQDEIDSLREKIAQTRASLDPWISLFSDTDTVQKISSSLSIEEIETEIHNIAGVDFPALKSVKFKVEPYDLFIEDTWLDDAIAIIKTIITQKIREKILSEQYERISSELRTTTQRVNLFEKVKIPETKENIRVIQINLGDQDTAGVARAKIAKSKLQGVA